MELEDLETRGEEEAYAGDEEILLADFRAIEVSEGG
jgi:hypothetical protein